MLKISEGTRHQHLITFQIAGQLIGPWVEELRQVCNSSLAGGTNLALRMEEVSFADDDGLMLLAELQARGVQLRQTTPFVAEQMKMFAPGSAVQPDAG